MRSTSQSSPRSQRAHVELNRSSSPPPLLLPSPDLSSCRPRLRFSDLHEFKKPNDLRALELMDRAAKAVMDEYPDVVLGFGESDEYRSANVFLTILAQLAGLPPHARH